MNCFPIRQSLSVILQPMCLVCERPLRNRFLCFRCATPLPNFSDALHSRCIDCFAPISPESPVNDQTCATCQTFPLATDSQRFVWEYRGLARDFIKAMKYRPSKKLARLAGIILRNTLPLMFTRCDWDLVVPIPSSATTFRRRCFHPCVEMGHYVARTLHIPLKLVLTSNPKRKAQAKLHHDARLRGIKKIFTLRDPKQIRGKRILLIEDVITTGATVSAAAQCLKAAGVTSVDVLALARTQAWSRFRHRVWVASGHNRPLTS